MYLPTKGTVRDCLGKHTVGLCNWNLDIISPCFNFSEDIFRLCEASDKDDLLWEEIKVSTASKKTNKLVMPTSMDQSTAVAVSLIPSIIFWMRGSKKPNISFLKVFMRIARPQSTHCPYLEIFKRPPWTPHVLSVSFDPSNLIKASRDPVNYATSLVVYK